MAPGPVNRLVAFLVFVLIVAVAAMIFLVVT